MRRKPARVPGFALYGEAQEAREHSPLDLHVEEIQFRSRRYRWEIAPHFHATLVQCLFISAGPAHISMDSVDTSLEGPAVAVVPARSVHAFRFSRETQGYVLTVSTARLTQAVMGAFDPMARGLFSTPRVIRLQAGRELTTRLLALFALLLEEYRRPDSLRAPVCASLTHALLWLLAREVQDPTQMSSASHRQHASFERFQALLEQRYREHWSVERYARMLGMSSSRLTRLCIAHSGLSAFDLVQRKLLIESQRRLLYTALSVKHIARELGFSDAAYFCRFFRRCASQSPRRYRLQGMNDQIPTPSSIS